MSMNPQVMQRYQQLVSQGVPTMQAYAQAVHEQDTATLPTLPGMPGVGTPAEALGVGGSTVPPQTPVSAPVTSPLSPSAPVTAPMSNPKSQQQPIPGNNPPPQQGPTSAQNNGTDDGDGDKGPKQPPSGGPGGAPSQAVDPTQAGPQSAYPGTPAGARNEQRFGYDPSQDSPGSWASRVFMEGLKDAGTNLYDPLLAGSPWGRFLSERYTPDLESRLILGEMNGGVGAGNESSFAQKSLADLANGGGSPAGGSPFDALRTASKNLSDYAAGGTFADPSQSAALGRMANDPIAQSNAILGGLRGTTGGFGLQFAQGMLGDLQRQYQNDPSQYQPSGFMAAALGKLGIH